MQTAIMHGCGGALLLTRIDGTQHGYEGREVTLCETIRVGWALCEMSPRLTTRQVKQAARATDERRDRLLDNL